MKAWNLRKHEKQVFWRTVSCHRPSVVVSIYAVLREGMERVDGVAQGHRPSFYKLCYVPTSRTPQGFPTQSLHPYSLCWNFRVGFNQEAMLVNKSLLSIFDLLVLGSSIKIAKTVAQ